MSISSRKFRTAIAPLQELVEWCEKRGSYHEPGQKSAADLRSVCYQTLIEAVAIYTKPIYVVMKERR